MKKLLLSITAILAICFSSKAQINDLEDNPNWKKYNTVKVKTPYGKAYWTYEYTLKDGKIESYKTFYNKDLRGTFNLLYDKYGNVEYLIMLNKDKKNDSVHFPTKYNNEGLKIESGSTKYTYNQNKQVEKKTSRKFEESIGKEGWSVSYQYDSNGNISRSEHTSFIKGDRQLDIKELTYDQYGNILTIDRSSFPTKRYPIPMYGGRSLDQHETFEYEYNDDYLWTKKYLVKKGKKILLAEREIK